MVTRLLERLPRWQLALISMAAGAGLFAGGMWIFNYVHTPDPVDRAVRNASRIYQKPKAMEVCILEAIRYGKHQHPDDHVPYVEQCMRVAGFSPVRGQKKCHIIDLVIDHECYE